MLIGLSHAMDELAARGRSRWSSDEEGRRLFAALPPARRRPVLFAQPGPAASVTRGQIDVGYALLAPGRDPRAVLTLQARVNVPGGPPVRSLATGTLWASARGGAARFSLPVVLAPGRYEVVLEGRLARPDGRGRAVAIVSQALVVEIR
ncbi:MAG TPA: hypothetical protein VGQ83_14435 [Polyangia bacterium]